MSKQCVHCGKVLLDNGIQYCPGCGGRIASSRMAKRPVSNDPPAWMKQLENSFANNRSKVPLRELNVKVWDEEETGDLPSTESETDVDDADLPMVDSLPTSPLLVAASSPGIAPPAQTPPSFPGIGVSKEDVAEDLPTKPYLADPPQNASQRHVSPLPGMDGAHDTVSQEQIENMATRPYAAQSRKISQGVENPVQSRQAQAKQTPPEMMISPAMQRPVTPAPIVLQQPQFPPVPAARQTPPMSIPVTSKAQGKKKNRKPLVIVFSLLLIAILGGVIAWVVIAQPFTVPEITRTTQNFTNTSPGLSLQYPQNWSAAVNKKQGSVNFYDTNHTDQVNINVVVTGNQNLTQYVSKMVSSLGITGQKTQPERSFAGASWQQVQGTVQESGASYTATLFATMHGEYFYTILQLAPSSTYPLEEQLVFSKIRSSFQF